MIDEIEYAERKYIGARSMREYMSYTYPSTYKTMIEFTGEVPDTSDCTDFYKFFYYCLQLTSVPKIDTRRGVVFSYTFSHCNSSKSFPEIDTSNGTDFGNMYYRCYSCKIFPPLNTSKGINFSSMYYECVDAEILPDIDTSNGTNFNSMYSNCVRAKKVSIIDFSRALDSELNGISIGGLLSNCNSLKTVTFKNLPVGTTETTLRNKCSIPSTVTEIIMNYRSE